MPEAAADPIGAVVALLLADSDVAAMVGTRGYGGELPPAETKQMPRTAFVVKASGGAPLMAGTFAEAEAQRIDVYTYGRTPKQAGDLSNLIALKLRRVQRQISAGTLLHWVNNAGGYSSGREPETDWPRAWRSFQVFFALVALG
jgi:hypothetical protein